MLRQALHGITAVSLHRSEPTMEAILSHESVDLPARPISSSAARSESMRLRFLKGVGANFLGQALGLISQALLVPLFLQTWGVDLYGEWLVLGSILAYLSLADMGGQLYVINLLTQAYTQGNAVRFQRVLSTAVAFFVILPTGVLLVCLAAALMMPPNLVPLANVTDYGTALIVLVLLALQIAYSIPLGTLTGVYRAVGLLPRGVMIGNALQLLQLLVTGAALLMGGGVAWVATVQIMTLAMMAGIVIKDLTKHLPEYSLFSLAYIDLSLARTFLKPSLHFLTIQLSQMLSVQGLVVLIGTVLGSIQVVVFTTMRTIVNAMKQLLGALSFAAWPEMTRLDSAGDADKLFRLFRALFRSTLVITALLTITLHYWGESIYHLWLGDAVEYQPRILDLFLVYILQAVLWTTCSHILMAINRHHAISTMLLGASLLTLVFSFLGAQVSALEGALIGIVASDVMLPLWYVPYVLYRYDRRFSGLFYLQEAGPVVAGLLTAVVIPWSAPAVVVLLLLWLMERMSGQGLAQKS